jgi:hypothetical protein
MQNQTEYSYQDNDNFVIRQRKKQNKRPKSKDSTSSSYDSSYDSDEERNSSKERPRKKSKYKKLKKVLKKTKNSLSKTKNMLEVHKLKNENQEEKIKYLFMEVENIKRNSLETMVVNKSMQSFVLNPGMINLNNQGDHLAFNTQRTIPDLVFYTM